MTRGPRERRRMECRSSLDRSPRNRISLTLTQADILRALTREPMSVPELAVVCGLTAEGVRSALPLLVAQRLVMRLSEPLQLGFGRPCVVYRRVTTWERAA